MPILLDVPAAIMPVRLAADRAVSLSLSHAGRRSPEPPLPGRCIGARDVINRLIEQAWPGDRRDPGSFPVIH